MINIAARPSGTWSDWLCTNNQLAPLEKVRISLLWRCNFRCKYCRPGGEGGPEPTGAMKYERILFLAKIFENIGCQKLNLTGGEPFLRSDISDIINNLILSTRMNITINTNGSVNLSKIDEIKYDKRISFAISLDSLNDDKLSEIGRFSNFRKIEKFVCRAVSNGFIVRINSIIINGCNDNTNDINKLIEWCFDKNIQIKLQSVFNTSNDTFSETSLLYKNLYFLRCMLLNLGYKKISQLNTKNGVPEDVYSLGYGPTIRLLDKNNIDTHYAELCNNCSQYPCDTGIYAYYVNEKEQLMICRNRRDVMLDFKSRTSLNLATRFLKTKLLTSGYTPINERQHTPTCPHPHRINNSNRMW